MERKNCPNCKIEMESTKTYIELETAGGTDVKVYMCPRCAYAEAEVD